MTERPEDKSHDCGRTISDIERFSWNSLMNALQLHDSFLHKGGPRFTWDNQQKGIERHLARLDRIYTPKNKGEDFTPLTYVIHGDSLGSDHAPVKLELNIGVEESRPSPFKWNASYLKDPLLISKIKDKWTSLPHDMSFLGKLRHVARFYRWHSKERALTFKREELKTSEELEATINLLHNDIYNEELQGQVNMLRDKMKEIRKRNAEGAAIRSRVQWK